MPRQSGLIRTLVAIEKGVTDFARPVLLIHGDEHALSIGRLCNSKGKAIPNVANPMVMGKTQVHAVRMLVDPDTGRCRRIRADHRPTERDSLILQPTRWRPSSGASLFSPSCMPRSEGPPARLRGNKVRACTPRFDGAQHQS
jgi:hypothetical protein